VAPNGLTSAARRVGTADQPVRVMVGDTTPQWVRVGGRSHVYRVRALAGVLPLPRGAFAPIGRARRRFDGAQPDEDRQASAPWLVARLNEGEIRRKQRAFRPLAAGRTPSQIAPLAANSRRVVPAAPSGLAWTRSGTSGAAFEWPITRTSVSPIAGAFKPVVPARVNDAQYRGRMIPDPASSFAPPAKVDLPNQAPTAAVGGETTITSSSTQSAPARAGTQGAFFKAGAPPGDATGSRFDAGPHDSRPVTAAATGVTTLHIDGTELGRWTIEHLSRALARPAMGMTSIDPRAIVPRSRVSPF
jgi:hypothetical protein